MNKKQIDNQQHRTTKGFTNHEPLIIPTRNIYKWMFQRWLHRYPKPPQHGFSHFTQQWLQPVSFSEKQDRVWWLGHASCLIQLDTITILTDPIFSLRSSPITFLGPKRRTPSPVTVNQLPHIDIVVISHDHYDHLDRPTIQQLIKRFPDLQFSVPMGLKSWFLKCGAQHVIELDWWQTISYQQIQLTFVPAYHWSKRQALGKNSALWGGWIIQGTQKTTYFMGDTGYNKILHEIGQRFSIDMALIPIGAYAPRWMMSTQHIHPAESVKLFQELKCKKALAIHWGTFELADEPIDEPPVLLKQELQAANITSDDFRLIKIGDSIPL